MIEKYEVHQLLSGQKDIQTADYNQEDYYEQECEAAWEECMRLWGGELELTDRVIKLLSAQTKNPTDFFCDNPKQREEMRKYSLAYDPENPEKQYAYELRSMGL